MEKVRKAVSMFSKKKDFKKPKRNKPINISLKLLAKNNRLSLNFGAQE